MLELKSITVFQFRNYLQQSFSFNEKVIGICGYNGTGKTNLLDAICYLSLTKSYFGRTDSSCVQHGLAGMRIEGHYTKLDDNYRLICILRENNKKELLLNDEPYKKFSDHIGLFPLVMVAPDDATLITGSSEERRKLLDSILSQINKTYLQALITYNTILKQRNSLLKMAAEQGKTDEALLEIISNQLIEKGNYIFEQRTIFMQSFLQTVKDCYSVIAGNEDVIQLQYISDLQQASFKELLHQAKQKDVLLQRTTTGIHKDEIEFIKNALPFKTEASQGQRKSLLFALKLAEWETLKANKGFAPLLLLDDVFEKLDELRMHNLLKKVCMNDGQIFITDTHKERLNQQLAALTANYQIIELINQ